jgi:hypothetical protein
MYKTNMNFRLHVHQVYQTGMKSGCRSKPVDELLTKWQMQPYVVESTTDYEFCDAVLAQRCSITRLLALNQSNAQQSVCRLAMYDALETMAKIARQAGRFTVRNS